jgi:methylmalonyl-CoA mutase N-terminal domain/subunit
LPSEHAVTIALRTQQVIAHESGIADVPDPLGGSYYLEWLTSEIERRANDYIRTIDEMGGMIPAIERGFPQTEIANASYEFQHAVETGESKIVGANAFIEPDEHGLELLQVGGSAQIHQVAKLEKLKTRRDRGQVERALDGLRKACEGSENSIPHILNAVRAYATVGEICDAFRGVFGTYTETSVL